MAIDRPSTLPSIDFAIVAISLAVIGTALGCLVFVTADHAAATTDPATRRYLARLAWMSLALLMLVVVLFVWLVVRRISARVRHRRRPAGPTPYLDAWTLAGQRFKLSSEDAKALEELEIEPRGDGESNQNGSADDAPPQNEDGDADSDKPGRQWR